MIIKAYAARNLLLEILGEADLQIQISEAAVFRLAQALEAYGKGVAREAFRAMDKENGNRRHLLRIRALRRLTDEHIEEAINGHA